MILSGKMGCDSDFSGVDLDMVGEVGEIVKSG